MISTCDLWVLGCVASLFDEYYWDEWYFYVIYDFYLGNESGGIDVLVLGEEHVNHIGCDLGVNWVNFLSFERPVSDVCTTLHREFDHS